MHTKKLTARFPDTSCNTQECDPLGANPVDLCGVHSKMCPPQAAQHLLKLVRNLLFYPQALISPIKRGKERYPLVFVAASLSNGINGGLMGYERMFYWKE